MYSFTKKDLDTLNALRSKQIKVNYWLVANQVKEAISNLIVFFRMGCISPASSKEIEKLCSLFNYFYNLITENKIAKENLRRERSAIAKEHSELESEAYRIAPIPSEQEKAELLISKMIDIEISLDKSCDQVFSLEIEEHKIRTDLREIEWKLYYQKELFEKREQEKLKLKKLIYKLSSFSWITIAINKITMTWKQKRIPRDSTQSQLANKLYPKPFEETTDTAKVSFDKEAKIKFRLAAMAKGRGVSFHLWD